MLGFVAHPPKLYVVAGGPIRHGSGWGGHGGPPLQLEPIYRMIRLAYLYPPAWLSSPSGFSTFGLTWFKKLEIRSIGMGKTMVLFFSAAISVSV